MRIPSKFGAGFAIAFCFFVAGCGGVGTAGAGVPAIDQIIPQAVTAGSGNTTVQIVGSHISDATVVLWNGNPLTTTLLNDTTVASPVESASLASPGTAELQLMNSVTGVKSAAVEFNISAARNAPPLAITTTSLPSGTVGSAYNVTLTATGGTAPYNWSVASGRMPAGLALGASGTLSGTPTAAGTYSVGLTVRDKSKPAQEKFIALTLIVAPRAVSSLGVVTTSLSAATYAASYSQALQVTGGTPSYSWAISSGGLPPGLSLSSTGVISGTPTMRGSFPFTATAKDSSSPQQSAAASLNITVTETSVNISTASLAAGTAGTAYSQALSASGGAAPYTWSIASGSLPSGLSLSTGGSITGTPAASGTFPFTVSVSDMSNPVETQTAAFSISIAAPALRISTTSLAGDTVGTAYSQALSAAGGTAPYTWSITSGTLPTGLGLSAGGSITGTPTTSGVFTFTASVSDQSNPVKTQSIALSIAVTPVQLKITPASFAQGIFGRPYSGTLQASGGTPGYSWAVSSGSLPSGLSLSSTSGAISGTPAASGTTSFTATVSDNSSPAQTASALMTISVAPSPLTITASMLPSVNVGTAYSQTLQAIGGTAPYQWSVSSGALPAGLTLSPATGTISGTPSTAGTAAFTASVTDNSSPVQTASVVLSLLVNPSQSTLASVKPLSILAPAATSGTAGSSYSQTLGASGGTSPYTWTIAAGSLPGGLTLSSGGTISGTLASNASGPYSVTVGVSDSESPAQTASATMTITVAAAVSPLSITSSTLVSGTAGAAYTQTMQATGGTPAYTWSLTSGSLPSGLSMSSTGVISGTPSTTGTSTITATVTDSGSPAQSRSITGSITISPAVVAGGTTWYIRPDGGSRYDAQVPTGQCDGRHDAPYPGSGVNQPCAFSDFRYMWDDQSYDGFSNWAMAGGDTVIIRGCASNSLQQNPSAPNCRIGWDAAGGWGGGYTWCYGGSAGSEGSPYGCYNPPVPSGTATQPTQILGQNYAACSTGNATDRTALTQIFGGFGVLEALNLRGTQYVNVKCIELTTHNGVCSTHGSPAYPRYCSTSYPVDDFAANGILTSNTSSNITLQDVYIHGFNTSGISGPIGGPINMTRVFIGFNGFAGWNFDDGRDTQDAPGSAILANYVTMEGNGCTEEYPIVHTQFSAQSCWDDLSAGFGDSWSGQDTVLDTFTCNHCVQMYNTKDGFIGPHTQVTNLLIENSESIGNMGQQWKWNNTPYATTQFINNLSIGNCMRFSQPIPGAAHSFAYSSGLPGAYLSDFCRAAGDMFSFSSQNNSTVLFADNTVIDYSATVFDMNCGPAGQSTGACGSTPFVFENNIFLGYTNTNYNPTYINPPGLFYFSDPSVKVTSNNNVEFGLRNADACTGSIICADPQLVNEPSHTWSGELQLDNFNFTPSVSSPAIGAGIAVNGITTDYYGITRPAIPTIGGVEP